MKECIKLEWERVIKGKTFYMALIIGVVIALLQIVGEVYPRAVDVLQFYNGRYGEPNSLYMFSMSMNATSMYKEILKTIFPVLAMLPHALSYHSDIKSGYVKNMYTRTKKINYLTAKYIATFMSAGIVIVITYMINFVIAACMLPALNPIPNGSYNNGGAFMQWMYFHKPLIYIFIYLIINWLYAGAFATTALAAAQFMDNVFMLSIFPFVLWYGMSILSKFIKKVMDFNIDPMRLTDIAQGYVVRSYEVMGVLTVVIVVSAFIYFVNGVKSDAL